VTQGEIGERMGQTQKWVSAVLDWRKNKYHAVAGGVAGRRRPLRPADTPDAKLQRADQVGRP
jgi:hypothetical protein